MQAGEDLELSHRMIVPSQFLHDREHVEGGERSEGGGGGGRGCERHIFPLG